MAQLPPKIPAAAATLRTSNWGDYHNKLLVLNNNNNNSPLSWVDEFLDFSSTRRASHRRSISDSDIAFSETLGEFDKIDDQQFLSMFGRQTTNLANINPHPFSSSSSSPSPSPTIHEDKCNSSFAAAEVDKQLQRLPELKNEPEEEAAEAVLSPSSNHSDTETSQREEGSAVKTTEIGTDSGDRITDPKRVKRILANRQSAQRSRVRKMQYVSDLERSVNSLQAEVSVLSPRVAYLDHQRLLLNLDNSAIKQRIAALAQDNIFKDAHQEALKKEIERLKKVHEQQQQIKSNQVENNNATATTSPPSDPSAEPKPAD